MKNIHLYIVCLFALTFLAGTVPPSDTVVQDQAPLFDFSDDIPQSEADSLQEHIMRMHDRAICTVERLMNSYKHRVWMAADSSQEARMMAWNRHSDFPKWMGKTRDLGDTVLLNEFEDRLESMHARLVGQEVTYEVKSSWLSFCKISPTNAFVRKGSNSRTIFLCPEWFEKRQKQQVATLLHELVHTFGFSHPNDTDTPLKAFALAKDFPELAIQSPENYESLAELYVCRIR